MRREIEAEDAPTRPGAEEGRQRRSIAASSRRRPPGIQPARLRDMSMESIAARAGVSKVSLYRRWGGKPEIMAEVFRLMSELSPVEDHGSFEADIRALLEEYIGSSAASDAGKIVMRTMGEISGDLDLLALYRRHFLEPRMDQLRGLVGRARRSRRVARRGCHRRRLRHDRRPTIPLLPGPSRPRPIWTCRSI